MSDDFMQVYRDNKRKEKLEDFRELLEEATEILEDLISNWGNENIPPRRELSEYGEGAIEKTIDLSQQPLALGIFPLRGLIAHALSTSQLAERLGRMEA